MTDRPRIPGQEETDIAPAEEGTRGDGAGSGGIGPGPAPNGGRAEPETRPSDEPSGRPTTAGGGYGVGSERPGAGGSADGQAPEGDDPQSDWLRQAPGGGWETR